MKRGVNMYKGLTSDAARDSIKDGYYIDALDIRITTDTGQSQGAITNLKGNSSYFQLPTTDGDIGVTGVMEIIGATSIRNTIIFFAADDSNANGWIFKLEYNDIDQSIIGIPNIIYKNNELFFSKERPIEAFGRYESDCISRVYWSDYEEFYRSINIEDPNLANVPIGLIDAFPNVKYTQPLLEKVTTGGELPVGLHQYAYRLITADGKETLISPPSILIHTTSDASSTNRTAEYMGDPINTNSNKAHQIVIDTSDYEPFESIELINVFHSEYTGTPQVFSIETKVINGDNEVTFTHTGAEESIVELDLFEYTIKQYPFKTYKSATQKDNSLIISNIKGSQFDVQDILDSFNESFEARTGRYNSGIVLPHPLTGTPEQIDAARLANAFNVNDINSGIAFDGYNMDSHWDATWHTDKQYKYKSNGTTLGGGGPLSTTGANISYSFHLEPYLIDGGATPGFANLANGPVNTHNFNDGYGTYTNPLFDSTASPFISGLVKGYKRGETYRFGIVFYNKKGESSFVEYIGDIKFPDISEENDSDTIPGINFHPVTRETLRNLPNQILTTAYAMGIKFEIDFTSCPNFLNQIESYQIVRLKREINDSKRLCTGIMKTAAKNPIWSNRGPKDIGDGFDLADYGDTSMDDGYGKIVHLFPWTKPTNSAAEPGVLTGLGCNGSFYNINDEQRSNLGGDGEVPIMGTYLTMYSPDISYNFPEVRENIIPGSMMLITGRYKDFYSQTKGVNNADTQFIQFNNNATEDLNSYVIWEYFNTTSGDGSTECLGEALDIRRSLRTVGQVDKQSPTSFDGRSYSEFQVGVEYVKQWKNLAIVDYALGTENNNNTSIGFSLGPYNGYDTSGVTEELLFFRNFYIFLDVLKKGINDLRTDGSGDNVNRQTSISKGATGVTGTINTVNNDPYTQDLLPASSRSQRNHFRAGISSLSTGSGADNFIKSKKEASEPIQETADKLSTPIVDIMVPRLEVYGGFSLNSLESNVFMPASPVIDKVNQNPTVFGGDIFITSFTFQEQSAWLNQKYFEPGGINGSAGGSSAYQWYGKNYSVTTAMFLETRVNVELAYGSTIKTGVENTANGGPSGIQRPIWRQETDNTFSPNAKILNMYNGAYNTAYSIESDDVGFFIKPDNFDTECSVNDIRSYISDVKINSEEIDSWTKFGVNNFYDVDDYGPINKIINFKDDVYFFQDKGFGKYSITPRAITSTDDGIPTELGSAEGFQDHSYFSNKHGSIHQWAITDTDIGIYYFDGIHKKIFRSTGQSNQPLSELKSIHGFLKNFEGDISLRKENGGDNPIVGRGVHVVRDQINNEVIFTFLGIFKASVLQINTLYEIGEVVEAEGSYYEVNTQFTTVGPFPELWFTQLQENSTLIVKPVNERTLVFDEVSDSFSSWYSATPPIYIENGDILLSPDPINRNHIYKHNSGNYGEFYGVIQEAHITLVLNPDADVNKILRFIEFNSIVRDTQGNIERDKTITGFRITTEYQDTNKVTFDSGRIKRKFDKWRLKIPRDQINGGTNRLRSTHFVLTLYFDNSNNRELILNKIINHYDIQMY